MIQLRAWRDTAGMICVEAGEWDWSGKSYRMTDHYWHGRLPLADRDQELAGEALLEIAAAEFVARAARRRAAGEVATLPER